MSTASVQTADFRILTQVLDLLNKERSTVNAPPLALSVQLCEAAQLHAQDMVARGYFGPVSPEGVDLSARALARGYKHKVCANLAMGPSTHREAATALLEGQVQRDNALDRRNLHLGLGRAGEAWVAVFGAPPPEAPGHDLQAPRHMMELINQVRTQAGMMPLRISQQLNQAALEHVRDMVARGYVAPRSPEGTSAADRARQAGFQGRVATHVAAGVTAADLVVSTWMGNEASRQNLLHADFRFLGAAMEASRWAVLLGTMPMQASATPELLTSTLALVNRHRQEAGVPELERSDLLTQAAQDHAQDMVLCNYCAATSPSGDSIQARIHRRGYVGQTAASFTLGHPTPEHALEALLLSPADKALLLDPRFTQLGIGVAESRWVLVYGLPQPRTQDPRALRVGRMVELINIERAKAMLPPLQPNDRLTEAAQTHAEDMQRRGYASGTTPEGEGTGQRVTRHRYPWRSLAELIAVDAPDPEPIVRGWMESPSHRGHLLKPELVHIGVGVAESRWDVLLARPQ
ncbi:MAG: CAP domain-containing protein [Myxococcales bacterium]|nr:CAP domain-containing protein [Myxococcota bacterium]MDW8282974.1 CAP domain-containing protein [Myxococcales bacterium]